jgi:hypothetical protein
MARDDESPSAGRLFEDDAGRARVWLEKPTVLAWVIDGRGTVDIARKVVAELDRLAPTKGEFLVFNDTERMATYDPGFRNVLTEWSDSKRGRLLTIHILTGSKFVAMGAAVANMMLGGNIKMYASRAAFEAAFTAAGGSASKFPRVA